MTKISGFLTGVFPAGSIALIALQTAAVLLIALVAGATFGIWRGYNPAAYSAATFLEMHQGAVRGLNTLLPATALAAIILSAILYIRNIAGGGGNHLILLSIVLMIAGGLATRFGNQPINAQVMTWTAETMPTNWEALRNSWWTWQVVRTLISITALTTLLFALLAGRSNG
jgi:hypothetical protein